MRTIEAHQTSDGQIFDDERAAKAHQTDILGQMLDDLLPQDDRGNVTQSDRYNLLTKQLNDPKLKSKITALYNALSFSEE